MAAKGSEIPGWLMVAAPAGLVALGAFFFYLTTIPAGNEGDAVRRDARSALEASAEQARKDAEKIGTAAKPSYDFYRLLEKQTVEVPVGEYKSTPKDAVEEYEYRLQAGSFRSASDADRMRATLLLDGLPAYSETSSVNGSTWYRVYVGPFADRSRLNKAQDILVSRRISPLVLKQKRGQ